VRSAPATVESPSDGSLWPAGTYLTDERHLFRVRSARPEWVELEDQQNYEMLWAAHSDVAAFTRVVEPHE